MANASAERRMADGGDASTLYNGEWSGGTAPHFGCNYTPFSERFHFGGIILHVHATFLAFLIQLSVSATRFRIGFGRVFCCRCAQHATIAAVWASRLYIVM